MSLVAGASGGLAGCAGPESVGTGSARGEPRLPAGKPNAPMGEALALHVLQRLSWGPRPGDVQALAPISLSAWLEAQLHPQQLPESQVLLERLQGYDTLTQRHAPVLAEFAQQQAAALGARRTPEERQQSARAVTALVQRVQGEARRARILRAVHSERQLQEVLVAFWFNHFNVFAGKESVRVTAGYFEAEAIRPHVFGRFRDLLGATAKHPAMLNYLDNWQSVAPGFRFPAAAQAAAAAQGNFALPRGLNENYARELLELHTLGVDGGYDQVDVTAVARVLTGWSFDRRNPGLQDAFRFYPARHDDSAKVILGQPVRGQGQAQGEWVLDLLARHPATARRISAKLARHFVSETPSEALVQTLTKVFMQTDGDLRALVRALVMSDEFADPAHYGVRYKAPERFVISAVRACGLSTPDPVPMAAAMAGMGMPLLLCPSPDGWPDVRSAWLTPEGLRLRTEFATRLATLASRQAPARQFPQEPLLAGLSESTRALIDTQPAQHRLALALASPDFSRY